MKTILFLALCSPFTAFASYHCQGDAGSLVVNSDDATRVTAVYNSVEFTGALTKSEGSIFHSKEFALMSSTGEAAKLALTFMPVMTRGGGFCGRGGCDTQPVKHASHISASFVIGTEEPIELTCYESIDAPLN